MRYNLNTIRNQHSARAISQKVVRAGAADFSQATQRTASESLNTTQGGTAYPVFIVGLHDPDDTETARWVL